MTHDTDRSTDQIERDIARERSDMSETLNELQEKFSFDAIVNDIGSLVRDQGGDLVRSVRTTVGRNPAAVVMVGVGLAWLFLGPDGQRNKTKTAPRSAGGLDRRSYRAASVAWVRAARPKDAGIPGAPGDGTPDASGVDDRAWYDRSVVDDHGHRGHGAARGNGRSTGGMDAALNGGASFSDRVSAGADSLGERAGDMTDWLSDGLDTLSEDAKSRVMSARRAALDARHSSGAALHRGSRTATTFFEDQPLVVGALALAAGAALGCLLPHSRIEDDAMGPSSDRLLAQAQAVFREERDRATTAVTAAAREVAEDIKEVASELGDRVPEAGSVGDTVADHAADAAGRAADSVTAKGGKTAKDEART